MTALPDEPALATAPETYTADDLFVSPGADRSVAAWIARLTGEAPASDAPAPVAPPVAEPDAASPAMPQPVPPSIAPGVRPADRRFIPPADEPPRAAVARSPDRTPTAPAAGAPVPLREDVPIAGAEGATEPAGQGEAAAQASGVATESPQGEMRASASPPPLDATETYTAESLFLPHGTDRSVGAWIERLTGGGPTEAPPSPAAVSPSAGPPTAAPAPTAGGAPVRPAIAPAAPRPSEPTPVAETTRRFLRPLVGIDPGSVPVHRDEAAAAVAGAYRADALTEGNVTLLAAGHTSDTPETLGLLAHELTHVARRRDARFVPPIAREDDRRDQPPAGAMSATSATASLADDEALARRVETRVVRAARAYRAAQSPVSSPAGIGDDRSGAGEDGATPFGPEPRGGAERRESDEWNGLPAPWEPLPDWTDAPATAMNGAPAPASAAPLAPVAPVAQLAAEGHGSDGAAPATTPARPNGPNAPVEPDLDALAQQVYGILKQRLAVEGQRFG